MSGTNEQVLRRFVELVTAGDLERAFDALDPGVVVHEADGLPYAGSYTGSAGFADLLKRVAETLDLRIDHTDLFDAGDTVVARMRTTLRSHDSGQQIQMPITEIYSFTSEGQISYVDVFYKDTGAVAKLVGSA